MFLSHTAFPQVLALMQQNQRDSEGLRHVTQTGGAWALLLLPFPRLSPSFCFLGLSVWGFGHVTRDKKNEIQKLLAAPWLLRHFLKSRICFLDRYRLDSDSGHIHTGGSNCGISFISGEK